MKFSVLTLSLICLGGGGGVLAAVHTDYRPDGTVEKIYNLGEEARRGLIHDLLPALPTKKKGCGKPPTSTLTTVTTSAASSEPPSSSDSSPIPSSSSVIPSSSVILSSSIPSSSVILSSVILSSSIPSSSIIPSSSSAAAPSSSSLSPPVCFPSSARCTVDDFPSCCSECCYFPTGDIYDGFCC